MGGIDIDEKKMERLRVLNLVKENIGLLSDEETEYLALKKEFDAAFSGYQENFANAVLPEVAPEQMIGTFTESDISRWKDGTQSFKEFFKVIQERSMQEKFKKLFNPVILNQLKAMFLKEKPVVELGSLIDSNNLENVEIIKLLKSFGMEIVGKYLFDKEQVQNVVEANEEVFKIFGSTDSIEIIQIINNQNIENNHLAKGILLGFPKESVKKFEHYEKERQKGGEFKERQSINVYGISWADFDNSQESKTKQARLKVAFEISGILKV